MWIICCSAILRQRHFYHLFMISLFVLHYFWCYLPLFLPLVFSIFLPLVFNTLLPLPVSALLPHFPPSSFLRSAPAPAPAPVLYSFLLQSLNTGKLSLRSNLSCPSRSYECFDFRACGSPISRLVVLLGSFTLVTRFTPALAGVFSHALLNRAGVAVSLRFSFFCFFALVTPPRSLLSNFSHSFPMKSSTLLALATAIATAAAGCDFTGGNYYCNQASKIIYEGVGFSGSYQDVTNMDESSGQCTQQTKSFLGSLSPFDEELSLHFRGPLKLVQFGVYYPSSASNAKRDVADEDDCSSTRHLHHKHVKRATALVTQTVYVDQNGDTITSALTTTPSTAPILGNSAPAAGGAPSGVSSGVYSAVTTGAASSSSSSSSASSQSAGSSSSASSSSSSSGSSSSAAAGDWVRASYYTPGTANNVTFLNYYGGSGSGVWSSSFGNSLSYANSDNSGGSSSAQILSDTTIPSNTEFVVMSGLQCGEGNGDCGYYRSGIPAFHGWDGQNKLFVFEFMMPSTSDTGFNGDMPAVWILNAKIPRTLQYGDSSCSCWKTGCGELDLFEILSSGSNKCVTALHDQQGGGAGSSDYFARPTSSTMKAAVIFTESNIHIMTVDSGSFDSVLSSDTVQNWISTTGTTVTMG